MQAVIHTHPRIGVLRRVLNRLRGLPPQTCHIAYEDVPHRLFGSSQGLAVCRTCGELHLGRPTLTEAEVDDVLGRRV